MPTLTLYATMKLRSDTQHNSLKKLRSGVVVCSSANAAGSLSGVCRRNAKHGLAIRDLTINVRQSDANLGAFRELIDWSSRIRRLTVVGSVRVHRSLLPVVSFTCLTEFVTDLPHSFLGDFISRQPRLQKIILLHDCRLLDQCPLGHVLVPTLTELQCRHAPCISKMARGPSVHAIALLTPSSGVSIRSVSGDSLPTSTTVRTLRIPFCGTEIPTLVQNVQRIAPHVNALVLEEYVGPLHMDHMPFALHREVFACDLHNLHHLRVLHLKLRGRVSMPADNESTTIDRWLGVCRRVETLRDILIWSELAAHSEPRSTIRAWSRMQAHEPWVKTVDRRGRRGDEDLLII